MPSPPALGACVDLHPDLRAAEMEALHRGRSGAKKSTPAGLDHADRGYAERCGDRGLGDPPGTPNIGGLAAVSSGLLRFVAGGECTQNSATRAT